MSISKKKQRQRSYKTLLAAVIVTGSIVAVAPANESLAEAASISFPDVKTTHHFYNAVEDLTARGVITGHADGLFKPVDANISNLNIGSVDTIVTLASNSRISNSILPNGKDLKDIIKNYDQVKNNVENVGGKPNPPAKRNFNLSIMHTNDTHASLDNVAKRVTAVKEVRAEKPDALLLDAGDVMSGTLYFNEYKGLADLEFMNLMKYDAMTFGNHEFDLGSSPEGLQALKDFVEAANFPFVSANVDFSKDDKFTGLFSDVISSKPEEGKIYQGIIKKIDGKKVGIFGLTTAETASLSSPGEIIFEDYKVEAEKAVKAFEGQKVDKIIAITHIGYDDNEAIDNDLKLAAEVEGIDVIVGGHSHTALNEPKVIDAEGTPTLIVQTGNANSNLGLLDVEFDNKGNIVGHAGELIKIDKQVPDPEAVTLSAPYKEKVEATSLTEIGVEAEVALTNPRTGDVGNTTGESVRKNETILGNLITDGMLAKAKSVSEKEVIMAFQNGGGIRAAIDAGPITVGEVMTVLPFANTLATMDVTGSELKAAFEISFKSLPGESGGFLHVAGAKVEYDSSKPVGERVISISYKNADGTYTAIEDTKTYTVATNAFTAKGGDGYTVLANAYAEGRVTDLGLSDWENLAEHLKTLTAIPTEIEGRIVDVNAPKEPVIDPGTTPASVTTTEPPLVNLNPENLSVSQIGRYDSGQGETGTEILAYDTERKLAFVTNGAVGGYDILSFAGLESGKFTAVDSEKRVVLADYGITEVKDITSIASHPTEDLIAITAVNDPKTDNGHIVFATKDGKYVKHVEVGALPDMVTFTPDGTKAIVANEGEPSDDYSADPEGSISIIDLKTFEVKTLTFTEEMLDSKVRVDSQGTKLEQLEPEYITVSADSTTAYVSLQENNAIATVNLVTGTILDVKGLGVKDHSVVGNELDAIEDGKILIEKQPILSFFMPDAIDTFSVADQTYIVTPNEGDARDYDAYSEEKKLSKIGKAVKLKAEHYVGYTQDELDAFDLTTLADYKVTIENGLSADGTSYEALYGYGGRSFSIFKADTMELVYDSGNDFETIIAENMPEQFNISNDKLTVDARSKAKGPEPETVVTGQIGEKTYAFIALERFSGIMVYDLSNPTAPEFVTLVSSRDFSADVAGDVAPEGLQFIPADKSPTGKALLAATNEMSGTVAVYEFGAGVVTNEPMTAEAFSGTVDTPKVHEGDVTVSITDATKLENATVNGNLIIKGTPTETFSMTNITVEGNLDLTGLDGEVLNMDGITVTGETTL